MKSLFRLMQCVIVIFVLSTPVIIHGATLTGTLGTVTLTCTDFTQSGFSGNTYLADRNNLGAALPGAERINITVTDGVGTVLYSANGDFAVGNFINVANATIPYGTPPAFNPLSYRFTSIAGNGFGEQVLVTASGTCPGLPTASGPASVPLASKERCPIFFDGRINDCDTYNSVVLYGIQAANNQWRLDIYAADQSGLVLSIPAETINAAGTCPQEQTLITRDAATGIALWRMAPNAFGNCGFILNAPATEPGKTYIVIFDNLFAHTYYTSWEE